MDSKIFSFGSHRSEVIVGSDFSLPRIEGAAASGLYVFDENTKRLFGADAGASVIVRSGEQNKSWPSVESILRRALEMGLARDSRLIGIGGGIICDVTAFAASLYMRGCRLELVPTTLLAMVDAGLGGKTGVNFEGYKNMVGSFYPAEKVFIFASALDTLPEREYRTGLAEVIKTAMLGDRELYEMLQARKDLIERRDRDVLEEVILRCIAVKGRIVEQDLREAGTRAYLNLGHTFAHALEAEQKFTGWTHGEAVAWGMAKAMKLGVATGVTPPQYAESVVGLLESYGFRTTAQGVDPDSLIEAMGKDKKKRRGRVRVVLQRGLGETLVVEADSEDLKKIVD
jgi:3-dehydroquinate synthase